MSHVVWCLRPNQTRVKVKARQRKRKHSLNYPVYLSSSFAFFSYSVLDVHSRHFTNYICTSTKFRDGIFVIESPTTLASRNLQTTSSTHRLIDLVLNTSPHLIHWPPHPIPTQVHRSTRVILTSYDVILSSIRLASWLLLWIWLEPIFIDSLDPRYCRRWGYHRHSTAYDGQCELLQDCRE